MDARNESGGAGPNVQAALAPMLETFIPGFSIVSGIFSSYFQIDLTYYVLSLCIFLGVATGIKHCSQILWSFISEYILSTAEIRYDDEIYNYLMFWVSKQNFSRSTTQFVAGTQTNTSAIWTGEDSDDKNTAGLDEEWETLDEQPASWDKIKTVHYTPSAGTHFFRFRGRILSFTRQKEESQTWFGRSSSETIYISCLGRNPQVLKDLLQDAQVAYHERDGNRTVIYRGSKPVGGSSDDMEWVRCLSRPPRPLSTVVLDEAQKHQIVGDMKEYLHPYTRRWYSNRGIPYRRGYLFHGPPGTGKTSLCFAVAGLLSLKIYVVSLNSRALTEDSLANLFRELPWRCIVLLEDIDSAGITAKRSEEPKPEDAKPGDASGPSTSGSGDSSTPPKGITLSGFLNIIDGVASSEGRILVMTTNHIEKLDPAILRPGRVDMTIRFGYADAEMIRGIYKAIFCNQEASKSSGTKDAKPTANGDLSHTNGHARSPSSQGVTAEKEPLNPPATPSIQSTFQYRHHNKTDEEIGTMADEFAQRMPSGEFTPAELQGYLLKHKNSPEKALESVEEFVKTTREEKELRKNGTLSSG